MTLIMVGFLAGYLGLQVNKIYSTNENSYERRDLTYSVEQMNEMNYTLGQFKDNFRMNFGFANWDPNFDSLNNPYVQFRGMEWAKEKEGESFGNRL